MQIEFIDQLKKQIGFLERSCRDFDSGVLDEAIRIATTIRILFHQTSQSTSLLKHLNATTINILSTVDEVRPNTIHFMSMCTITICGDGTYQYKPSLDESTVKKYIPVSKWWAQPVIISDGVTTTRKNIVLSAANKDGGAHVDAKQDPDYKKIASKGFSGTVHFSTGNTNGSQDLENTHLMCLRQMGYEVLNSPELVVIYGS